jgi:RsiW-degrading membrane proteinase PrsW (M82 family)
LVFISAIVEKALGTGLDKNLLTAVSFLIACIPPILWMAVFYRQDRINPEPKSYVLKILILGALVQKAVYEPIAEFVFQGDISRSLTKNYIVTIIVLAVIQETVKLLSVRYSIYSSREFDEKVDGIIYGSALGLGFAAMTMFDLIVENGGAMLTNITSLVVIETFSHASITGLSCYILGVSKQAKPNILRLPAAVMIASALNAITQVLLDAAVRNGFKVNYKAGLIPAALLAVLVFSVLVVISSKNEREGNLRKNESIEPRQTVLGIIPVWIILAAALAGAFVIGHTDQRTSTYKMENIIELKYPSEWIRLKDEECVFKAGGRGIRFASIKSIPLCSIMSAKANSQGELLQNAAAAWSIKSGLNYRFYQSVKSYFLNTKGKESYVTEYVYIDKTDVGSGNALEPSIGYARDILSIAGDDLYITTVSFSYEDYILNEEILNEVDYSFSGN